MVPFADAMEMYYMMRNLAPMQILASKIPKLVFNITLCDIPDITVHDNQAPSQATSSGSSPAKVWGCLGIYTPSIVKALQK
jgi:hypothetical protein